MTEQTEVGPDTEEPAAVSKPPAQRRKLLIGMAALMLMIAAASAYILLFPSAQGRSEDVAEVPETFIEVEPMQVNLRGPGGTSHILKVHFVLVPGTLDEETIKARLPLVIDSYQPFLRELRPEDVAGSAAVFRLKEEMLVRANDVLGKGSVRDVLIQDLLQQ